MAHPLLLLVGRRLNQGRNKLKAKGGDHN